MKTIIPIIVYNRYENLKRWLECWGKCDQTDAELIVIHNYDNSINQGQYRELCEKHKIRYFARVNSGFDIGAMKDFCMGNIRNIPEYDYMLWITDDTIPMRKGFVKEFTNGMIGNVGLRAMEISNINAPLHVRTTGFCITKEIAGRLIFPDRILTKLDCYFFEHRGGELTLMRQVLNMGFQCIQISNVQTSPLWDTGNRAHFMRMKEHEKEFGTEKSDHVTIICPVFNTFPEIIGSMINQTHKNWTLKLIHDGPNNTGIYGLVKQINDPRIVYTETAIHSGKWGHSLRAKAIQELSGDGYVVISNADNHHVPGYLEHMLKGFTNGQVGTYCSDMIHSYIDWKNIPCRLARGYVDCAGVMLRADVAKRVGWNNVEDHSSDWIFFEEIIKMYGANNFEKVAGTLLIHN